MDGTGEHIIDMAPKWMNGDYQVKKTQRSGGY